MSQTVAIYCRLSEEDRGKNKSEDDSMSIQNQKMMLTDFSLKMGWEIYDIYCDDDYTGSDRRRPAFNKMLKDAEARKFNIILCKSQSRFTREMELVEKYIHGLFPIWGIRFVSIVDNSDTENEGNKKSRQILGLTNEWYLEDMSRNIKAALDSRRKNGFHIGSFALYGYKKDPEQKGHLIIDDEAAFVVREVFELYSGGYGKAAIARILNARGIPNPTEYKRLKGIGYKHPTGKNGTLWRYSAISSMLRNQIYIGNMVQGKYESVSYKTSSTRARPKSKWYIVEGTHDPIIGRELWEKVQEKMAERSKPFADGKIGVFAGKVRCAQCGYILRSTKSSGKTYLQCPSRHYYKESCEGAFISVKRLEEAVISELNRISSEYLDIDELLRKFDPCERLRERKKRLCTELVSYNTKNLQYNKGLCDIYLDKAKGIISENDFVMLSENFRKEKSHFEKQISEGEKELLRIEAKLMEGNNTAKIIKEYINVDKLTREMADILIDRIDVHKRIPGTRDVPIEIYWNF